MIYEARYQIPLPSVDLLTLLFDSEHCLARDDTVLHSEARDPSYFITKARARSLTEQIAYFLRHHYNIGKSGPNKDLVVTLFNGQSALPCLFYGVLAAEGVYSAALPLGTAADIARQIKDGPGKVLICSEDLEPLALSAARKAGLPDENVLTLRSYPHIELKCVDGSVKCEFRQSLHWRKITDPTELENSKICLVYSSGTTGLPKGVSLSHNNIVSQSILTAMIQRSTSDKWRKDASGLNSKNLAHLPPGHLSCILLYCVYEFLAGGTVYWMPTFNFDDFMQYMQELRIPVLFTVPPVYTMIAKNPAVTDQFKHVRYAVMGAGPLRPELHQAARKKLSRIPITLSWGLTETTGGVTLAGPEIDHPVGSSSQLLPNIQLRLVDDDDTDVPPGQPGEALVKGPVVMKGYHNNPEANKIAFTSDGWLRTGDILRVENDLLYMIQRKKELIKYKCLQIAPAELEGILCTNPAVSDAVVIGIPQNDTEVPRAYVVLAPGWKDRVSAADLITYVNAEVAEYKQLRGGMILVDALPKSATGKLLRQELREMWNAEL